MYCHSLGPGPGMTHRPMRGLDFRKQQTGAVGGECCVPRWWLLVPTDGGCLMPEYDDVLEVKQSYYQGPLNTSWSIRSGWVWAMKSVLEKNETEPEVKSTDVLLILPGIYKVITGSLNFVTHPKLWTLWYDRLAPTFLLTNTLNGIISSL